MGRRKTDRNFWDSAMMNNRTYIQYYNRLTELAISMFEWSGLPDTVDPRFLELTLFSNGVAVFFEDEVEGFLCLQAAVNGQMDVYRTPIDRRAYAVNGYSNQLTNKDSVLIYNNMLRTNSMLDVEMFAKRLYEFDRIIDVNVRAQKTPVLIECDENERLTMENLYMKFDGNMPYIFGSKQLNAKGLTVLKTDAPYVADKIYQLKTQYWNEALTYLGIANVNTQKKERLISDEVRRNMGGVVSSRYSRLNARQEACEKINKMFGLDIWCEYKDDYELLETEDIVVDGDGQKAGDDNE